MIDLASLKPDIEVIGKQLVASGTLTKEERTKVGNWTIAMGEALATGDTVAVGNYKVALSTMLGVAEIRAAQASERAALRLADVALGVITKIALAAI